MERYEKTIAACLAGVAFSLILVGVVSGTVVRHLIQIAPLVIAAGVVMSRAAWAPYAAMPLFAFWTAIMVLIWLFLLGLSRIASGRFTLIEIFLTIVMAALSLTGIWASARAGRRSRLGPAIAAFVAFAAMQFAAMWASFLRHFRID